MLAKQLNLLYLDTGAIYHAESLMVSNRQYETGLTASYNKRTAPASTVSLSIGWLEQLGVESKRIPRIHSGTGTRLSLISKLSQSSKIKANLMVLII